MLLSGIDMVTVARVRRMVDEAPGLLERLCSHEERRQWIGARRLAELLAAKEAAIKALNGPGADAVNWHEIVVEPGPRVRLRFTGELAGWAAALDARWHCSTASTRSLAIAAVMAEMAPECVA